MYVPYIVGAVSCLLTPDDCHVLRVRLSWHPAAHALALTTDSSLIRIYENTVDPTV